MYGSPKINTVCYNIAVITYYEHNAGKRFVLTVSNTVEILFGVRIYDYYWWYCFVWSLQNLV